MVRNAWCQGTSKLRIPEPSRTRVPGLGISTEAALERELQSKLNLPRSPDPDEVANSGTADAEISIRKESVWIDEIRMIEDVEHLGAKLQVGSLGNRCVLDNGDVEL